MERPLNDSQGRTIWIVDAHRDDGKRFVMRADEKLTAFLELESAIRIHPGSRWRVMLFTRRRAQTALNLPTITLPGPNGKLSRLSAGT